MFRPQLHLVGEHKIRIPDALDHLRFFRVFMKDDLAEEGKIRPGNVLPYGTRIKKNQSAFAHSLHPNRLALSVFVAPFLAPWPPSRVQGAAPPAGEVRRGRAPPESY